MAKILYIEDIEDNIILVQRYLSGRGHEVHYARNAGDGYDLALQIRPDLILLDLGLPDADGQTLSTWLKGEPDLEAVPLIALTAWPEEVARQTVAAYGLDGYLCKPFRMEALLRMIEAALQEPRR